MVLNLGLMSFRGSAVGGLFGNIKKKSTFHFSNYKEFDGYEWNLRGSLPLTRLRTTVLGTQLRIPLGVTTEPITRDTVVPY